MPDPILINSPGALKRAQDELAAVPLDGSMQVQFSKARQKRSLAQHKLMWTWHTVWAEHVNTHRADFENPMTKDLAHDRYKWRHIRPILCRSDDELGELCALAELRGLTHVVARKLSTKDVTVDQMREALDEYDRYAISKGCNFPRQGDDYYTAIGRRMAA